MDCLEKRKNRKLADGALNQWFTSSAKIGQGIENASAENNDLPGFGFNGIKGKDNPTVITVDDED